jgi:hypothetical protein
MVFLLLTENYEVEGVGWRPKTKGLGFGWASLEDFYRGTGFFYIFFYIIAA